MAFQIAQLNPQNTLIPYRSAIDKYPKLVLY